MARARDQLADDLRFNVDTNTGVLPEKLQAGDTYTVTALAQKVDAELPKSVDVADGTVVDSQNLTFIDDKISPWTERVDGQWEKVVAVAKAMQDGAYTDGGAPGDYQNIFLPGHSLRRMTQFMKATQLAGNDEQYAAGAGPRGQPPRRAGPRRPRRRARRQRRHQGQGRPRLGRGAHGRRLVAADLLRGSSSRTATRSRSS